MIELRGKYNNAKVFTNNIEETAISQIIDLCNQPFTEGSKIRIMPDTHAGSGCTIGTTMVIKDKIVPNMVGVDIGCGMECIKISDIDVDYSKLDAVIRNYVPSGFSIRNTPHRYANKIQLGKLRCFGDLPIKVIERARLSIGTLGGGNHFIEMDRDSKGLLYLVIHSGSRNLGLQVAKYYQKKGYDELVERGSSRVELIQKLQHEGRAEEIESEIQKLKIPKFSKQLAYVQGQNFKDYLHDMQIVQNFATFNRMAISDQIVNNMGFDVVEELTTIHNYIDIDNMILRKGAISAQKGEKVIIPINMRDGSLLCVGKGNEDWNCSAPHGAGRIMSRTKAKENVELIDFENSMKDVYTTSVSASTLDEAPMVYKPMQEILDNIKDTAKVIDIIKPTYNYKAN